MPFKKREDKIYTKAIEKENLKSAVLKEATLLAKEHGSKDIRFFANSVIKLIEG